MNATDIRQMIARHQAFHAHAFERTKDLAGIDLRETEPRHPPADDQIDRTGQARPSGDSITMRAISPVPAKLTASKP